MDDGFFFLREVFFVSIPMFESLNVFCDVHSFSHITQTAAVIRTFPIFVTVMMLSTCNDYDGAAHRFKPIVPQERTIRKTFSSIPQHPNTLNSQYSQAKSEKG